jgi:hypothetical protein
MKRALVVLLALVMGAGLVFAADQAPAKWGAYLEGNFVFWNQDGQVAATDWYTAYTLSYAESVFGFTATMEPAQTDFAISWRNVQGWYKLFDGMLKITLGKDRIGDYRATTFIEGGGAYTRIANAEWGTAFQVYPVEGLSAGVFVKFPTALADQDYVNSLGVGVSYAVAKVATINALFRTMDSGIVSPYVDNELGISATINAIDGLALMVGYGVKLYDSINDPLHNILLSAKFTSLENFTFMLDANLAYQTVADYAVELEVDYALNESWTAGVNLEYGTNGYGPLADTGFYAYPWIQLAVGSASSLKFGFAFETDPTIWSIPLFYVMSF